MQAFETLSLPPATPHPSVTITDKITSYNVPPDVVLGRSPPSLPEDPLKDRVAQVQRFPPLLAPLVTTGTPLKRRGSGTLQAALQRRCNTLWEGGEGGKRGEVVGRRERRRERGGGKDGGESGGGKMERGRGRE